ncbi:MAG: bifunctional oligoribonuclease/PAP phosphatase NrnA [Gemmatimonadaceae bacterium]|nr:bifunctional oligoribonuclease/PAP phosphatase NrnA [Chitinophagaceae bacterium]
MKPINEIYPLLTTPKKVVITTHQKPDPDAMGSSLGLYHFLKSLGHTVTVISPTNWPGFLNWMPGCDLVIDFEYKREKALEELNAAEWIFCLDFNTLSRTKNLAPFIAARPAVKILIDHHQQPEEAAFDYGDSNTIKSSTSEMVYDFIVNSGYQDRLSLEIAECLYAGLIGDTGSFRFPSASAHVHSMVADLKSHGLNHTIVHENIYDNYLENRLRFIGMVLLHRMEIMYEYNTALIAITKKDLLRFDIKTGDTEGLVNYPLSIKGIRMAAIVIDRDEERKWSFRSKGHVDVNTFARKYFDGGGHFNAAGGKSIESLEKTVEKFKQVLSENTLQLQ